MNASTTLTWRATLTLISNSLTQATLLLSQLIITPILLTLLGVDLYGAWIVLQNSLAYVLIVDLRAGATLRFKLGTHQHEDDLVYKRTQVGGALVAWLVTVPLLIFLGLPLIWWAPEITGVPATLSATMRLAMGILVLWMVLNRLVGIPVDILAAHNLEYRAMGLRTLVVLTTSFGMVLAAYWGWGLPGMAMIVMVAGLVEAGVRFVILRRNVPWLGVIFPNRAEVMTFLSFSVWLLLSNLGQALLISSQYVLVGLLFNPALVTIYAITGGISRYLFGAAKLLFDAGDAGVLQIVGEKDFVRLERVRHELHLMTLGFMVFVGATTLLLNESFIGLWVGQQFFGGVGVNLTGVDGGHIPVAPSY